MRVRVQFTGIVKDAQIKTGKETGKQFLSLVGFTENASWPLWITSFHKSHMEDGFLGTLKPDVCVYVEGTLELKRKIEDRAYVFWQVTADVINVLPPIKGNVELTSSGPQAEQHAKLHVRPFDDPLPF